ncbi:GNAT family N-acetyltransferase [Achromobacter insuavis]|uniref:Putative acetyltransferase n=1 Tax=Achromobacter insuavis AXX-A TaxID=1003200 RepID=F7T9K8_9BURK|nr:GNAT family N-acetyltransferase [Achromobacter insuavis]EGP43013.1 putative acetyltransferase [Achromobacter insuavis AXX-A]
MTQPIHLERLAEHHLPGMAALYNDPAVARQVLQMPYQLPERWRKLVDPDNERLLALVATHQGEVIGSATLEQFARVRRSHCGAIGMGVARAWQRQGVGSRLLAELLSVADGWMNLRRVELTVYSDNEAAVALYRKHGFEVEGHLRDYAIRDGRYVDVTSMARLRAGPASEASLAARTSS